MKQNNFIRVNGELKNYPKHHQICITKSIISDTERICIFDDIALCFYPIVNGVVDHNIILRDSAKYWKPYNF